MEDNNFKSCVEKNKKQTNIYKIVKSTIDMYERMRANNNSNSSRESVLMYWTYSLIKGSDEDEEWIVNYVKLAKLTAIGYEEVRKLYGPTGAKNAILNSTTKTFKKYVKN